MIKLSATKADGRKLVALAITAENVQKLMDGKPISVDGKEIGIDCDIAIIYGRTEKDLFDEFVREGLITEKTQFVPTEDE